MVIYSEDTYVGLLQYGILIPVSDRRARRTFEGLLANPELAAREAEWHLPHGGAQITREDLLRAHSSEYVARLYSKALEQEIIRTYELLDSRGRYHRYDPGRATRPLEDLLERTLYNISGSYQSCQVALRSGFCFYLGGGMHHAHRDFGKGFCLLNDVVIAARKAQAAGLAGRLWVVDVDAHKGDGTAAITAGDDSIRTLSVHMAAGWPLDEEQRDAQGRLNPSFIPSDIDIPIARGEEPLYVGRLAHGLKQLAELGPADLALVVSGADPYEHDELPSTQDLRLSKEQMFDRDRLIYTFLKERGVPAAYLMSGGYGERSWEVYQQFLEWALLDRLGPKGPAAPKEPAAN
jgi:acetoin utilization deacetylase AcuC-like enzyme